MTPEELQATLAQAHRQIARYRNALNAVRFEAIAIRTAPYHVREEHVALVQDRADRIMRLVQKGLGE